MKIKSLEIKDFRGIPHLTLSFPNQINVIAGINGSGKSTILDCLAIMLSALIGRIRTSKGTGRNFTELDISNGKPGTSSSIEVSFSDWSEPFKWTINKNRTGRKTGIKSDYSNLDKIVNTFFDELNYDEIASLPIAIYYPVHRYVLDTPLRIRKGSSNAQFSAYDQALSKTPGSFSKFFEWFRAREDIENEMRLENNNYYRDPKLQAIREAVEQFLPGFEMLRVKRSPLHMVVNKDGRELNVNQLSDGEKCLLAMIGDLARRLSIANPSLSNPLEGRGVVLIDEIDLHLHPSWQRKVIPRLGAAFPNCQFILSTHSPQILSHLTSTSIWMIERNGESVTIRHPDGAYGLETDRILEDLMGVSARPQEIKDKFTELFLAIEMDELPKAEEYIGRIQEEIGEDPSLVKANLLIKRKKVLQK